jgi:hypothetical protein
MRNEFIYIDFKKAIGVSNIGQLGSSLWIGVALRASSSLVPWASSLDLGADLELGDIRLIVVDHRHARLLILLVRPYISRVLNCSSPFV